jgi:hypothetical protein
MQRFKTIAKMRLFYEKARQNEHSGRSIQLTTFVTLPGVCLELHGFGWVAGPLKISANVSGVKFPKIY